MRFYIANQNPIKDLSSVGFFGISLTFPVRTLEFELEMGNRAFKFQTNTFYHIYNRGNNKQQLFFEERDYERFLNNIPRYKEKFPNIKIPAWCLLPNHFHFILIDNSEETGEGLSAGVRPPQSSEDTGVRTPQSSNSTDSEQISQFMQKLQQAYACAFNAKYREKLKQGLKAPIFEGRFQAKAVEDDDYLEQLKTYVEYNAVKHELVSNPEDWVYTSLHSSNSAEFELEDSSKASNPGLEKDSFDPFFE